MQFFKKAFEKLTGGGDQQLRAQYHFAREFTEALRTAEQVYANDPGKLPIKKTDYLTLLDSFESLLSWVPEIPGAYDTDFRRNLPGGGIDGLEVLPNMAERINQARRYLAGHEATATAGQCIVQNIDACLGLIPHDANVEDTLKSMEPTVLRIASGVIR